MVIPNIIDKSFPIGKDDSENVEVQRYGEPKVPDFEVPYHTDIMERFDGIDLDSARKVAGNGFYYLMGDIARLHSAVISYARDFISGIISYEQLCKAIMLGNLGEQICLKSKKAFELIRFTGYQKVDYNEWYPKKMSRDIYARNGYKAMGKENYRKGELYITKIIDEELKADDLRI